MLRLWSELEGGREGRDAYLEEDVGCWWWAGGVGIGGGGELLGIS